MRADQGFGAELPRIVTPPPGIRSKELGRRLARVESRNITAFGEHGPIFWESARGANVRDADGNVYVDLSAGFGVAAAGHASPHVSRAIARQAETLAHALGDVQPAEVKVLLLEKLAELAPGGLSVGILASAGAEAVEAALKTAMLSTGRAGVLSFSGSYHGLTYGALAATGRSEFRLPFREQLFDGVVFVDFPRREPDGSGSAADALARVEDALAEAERSGRPVGALLVEPLQGRGGMVDPPDDFLPGLRSICDRRGALLVADEIYTGFGRTGRWFACEHAGVAPDIMTVGKALTGALPLSAALGTPEVMEAWPPSTGEALHTSTFLGNPISCAAALAQIEVIEREGLVERAATLGSELRGRLEGWRSSFDCVADVRGRGLMLGVELNDEDGAPDPVLAASIADAARARGVLILTEGPAANVLAFTPPLVITREQLEHATTVIEEEIAASARL